MRAFSRCVSDFALVNNANLDMNCYYCTAAALSGRDAFGLVYVTETMQQDLATVDEIERLFADAGIPAAPCIASGFQFRKANMGDASTQSDIENLIQHMISPGQSAGLGYVRRDGSGHMVVIKRASNGPFYCVDYQAVPGAQNRHMSWPPEGASDHRYIVWLREDPVDAEDVADLTDSMANLRI